MHKNRRNASLSVFSPNTIHSSRLKRCRLRRSAALAMQPAPFWLRRAASSRSGTFSDVQGTAYLKIQSSDTNRDNSWSWTGCCRLSARNEIIWTIGITLRGIRWLLDAIGEVVNIISPSVDRHKPQGRNQSDRSVLQSTTSELESQ